MPPVDTKLPWQGRMLSKSHEKMRSMVCLNACLSLIINLPSPNAMIRQCIATNTSFASIECRNPQGVTPVPVVKWRVDLVHAKFPQLCAERHAMAWVIPEQVGRDQHSAGSVEEDDLRHDAMSRCCDDKPHLFGGWNLVEQAVSMPTWPQVSKNCVTMMRGMDAIREALCCHPRMPGRRHKPPRRTAD